MKEIIINWTEEEYISIIRRIIDSGEQEKLRFNMSGYDSKTSDCTLHNMKILNKFAESGIYDYTYYLFLDFYKGTPTLYMRYWNEEENIEIDFDGYKTVDIIYEILKLTVLSGKEKRRR
jgi:hypothetical protein